MVAPGAACADCGGGLEDRGGSELKKLELPEQPASRVPAVASKPASERRRVGNATGAWGGISADTAVLLTTALSAAAIKATPICHSGGEWLTKWKG
jgi:transcription elongation factor